MTLNGAVSKEGVYGVNGATGCFCQPASIFLSHFGKEMSGVKATFRPIIFSRNNYICVTKSI